MSAAQPDGASGASVVSVNTSDRKGVAKTPQPAIELAVEHGVAGDAHAGPWHRQVSLLALESIEKMRARGANVSPGAFGENITTSGIVVHELPVGTRLRLGPALVEVTQIGKECHDRCAIYFSVGDCVMPREGIFVRVLEGGKLAAGDRIVVAEGGPGPQETAAADVPQTAGQGAGEIAVQPVEMGGDPRAALIKAAVLTISDKGAAGLRTDESGEALQDALHGIGVASVQRDIVSDEAGQIAAKLRHWADETDVNLVLTTGGTGFTSRDVTPEATLSVLDRAAPGFAEAMRAGSLEKTPHAMLSRAVSGLRRRTLIINMPGSPRACREQFAMIAAALPHGIEKLLDQGGDCAR